MSISKIDICNLALAKFGQGSIVSLDDNCEEARVLSLNYDNCLESALRAFPWNFAQVSQALAEKTDTLSGWEFVYAYPSSCVKIHKVYSEDNGRVYEKSEFKIFSNGTEKLIACDIENAYAEFTYLVVDPGLYDSLFVKALSYLLAAEVVDALSGNSQRAVEMMQKYQLVVSEAQFQGAVENYTPPPWPTSYKDGRR